MFSPASIALVGASERSAWTGIILHAIEIGQFGGNVELVNGRGGEVFGKMAKPRLTDLDSPVDLAVVSVPGAAVLSTIEDAIAAGVRNAVVFSAGFAETGAEGRSAQDAVARLAIDNDLAILGPNTLGFLNTYGGINVHPSTLSEPPRQGHLSLVSQSGALNGSMLGYCQNHGIGISKVISVGNEAVLDAADVLTYLAEDEDTRAIGVFLEAIRRPSEFVEALEAARARSKPVIVLKAGRHEVTARVAAAHTGAFVGDDRVIDAVLRQYGAIRVNSLEELVNTADVMIRTGALGGNRLVVAGISGGGCDIIADRATDAGLDLHPFTEGTEASLRSVLADFGAVNNPLDVTGAAVSDPSIFTQVITTLGGLEDADVIIVQYDVPTSEAGVTEGFRQIVSTISSLPKPALLIGNLSSELPSGRDHLGDGGDCCHPGGMEQVIAAIGRAAWWSARLDHGTEATPSSAQPDDQVSKPVGSWSEARARDHVASFGVPVVPAAHALDADAAVAAASSMGFPVVVKANGAALAHKTELGAVELDLRTEDDVRNACERIAHGVRHLSPDGFLVAPFRPPAVELIVGVARTEAWGPILAVGFGGVLTEIQADTSLRRLPVGAADVDEMLAELTNATVLEGVRGRPAADRQRLIEVVLSLADAALALGDDLEALEVNPLAVDGGRIEALDALVTITRPDGTSPVSSAKTEGNQ
ncbi:MAG: acetate--CoA ligase family protein [Acidimicrobiales bacterium]